MNKIKIEIELPEEAYKACIKLKSEDDDGLLGFCLINAVANGTPIVEKKPESKTILEAVIDGIKAEINEIKANALYLYRTSPSEQTRKMASEKSYTCDDILRGIDREIRKANEASEPVKAYKCDPKKNTACKKTGCYERGGFCELTLNPEFAKEDEA